MGQYLFGEEQITCVSLEAELGLNRGDISRLTIYPSGTVEIETAIALLPAQQVGLKNALDKRGLGRGQKPNRLERS